MTDSKVFIDTSPFIYILEDNVMYSDIFRNIISKYYTNNIPLYTSLLTFSEYCVVPYRKNDSKKIDDFEEFIADADIIVVRLTKQIAKYAAWLRSKYQGIKALDALQLASAIQNDCNIFLTNDKQLRQVQEIQVITADKIIN